MDKSGIQIQDPPPPRKDWLFICVSWFYLRTNKFNWFYEQALAPKEKDNMDSIGGEVEDEINATAEVR